MIFVILWDLKIHVWNDVSLSTELFLEKPQKNVESTFTRGFRHVLETLFDCVVILTTLVQEITHHNYIPFHLPNIILITWDRYFEKKVGFTSVWKKRATKKKFFTKTSIPERKSTSVRQVTNQISSFRMKTL